MPSRNEVEATAKALVLPSVWRKEPEWARRELRTRAEIALTAAELVRDQNAPITEARTQNIHTCHTDCPCQTGGEPRPDFVEGRTQPCEGCDGQGVITATLGGTHDLGEFKCPDCQPETGRPEVERLRGVVTDLQRHLRNAEKVERRRIVALIEGVAMPLYDPDGNADEYHAAAATKRRILTAIQEADDE